MPRERVETNRFEEAPVVHEAQVGLRWAHSVETVVGDALVQNGTLTEEVTMAKPKPQPLPWWINSRPGPVTGAMPFWQLIV